MRAEHILSFDCAAASVSGAMRGTTTHAAAAAVTIGPPAPPVVPVTPEQAKLEFVIHKRKRSPAAPPKSHPGAKASTPSCTHKPPPKKNGRKLTDLAALQCSRICIRGISSSGPSRLVHIQPRRQPGTENENNIKLRPSQREEKKSELQQKRKWEAMERGGLMAAPMQQPACQ